MVEIAISLAVIGFALVAIVGILPIGMGVQKENRQETVINQDATVFINAIRNGAMGLDDLTNYVFAITNDVTGYGPGSIPNGIHHVFGYTTTQSSIDGAATGYPINTGLRIIGLLSTPKYVADPVTSGAFYSNHVVAFVRSISGPANEKYPQNNPSVQDLTFSYRLAPEVVAYGTNYFDYGWLSAQNMAVQTNLQNNLHDLRLFFRWPLLNNGNTGPGKQVFRTLAGGLLWATNEITRQSPPQRRPVNAAYDLYFFQPQTFVK